MSGTIRLCSLFVVFSGICDCSTSALTSPSSGRQFNSPSFRRHLIRQRLKLITEYKIRVIRHLKRGMMEISHSTLIAERYKSIGRVGYDVDFAKLQKCVRKSITNRITRSLASPHRIHTKSSLQYLGQGKPTRV